MDSTLFDALTRRLAEARSRRATFTAGIAAFLTMGTTSGKIAARSSRSRRSDGHRRRRDHSPRNAHGDQRRKPQKQRDRDNQTGAEACIPTGKRCPAKKPRGKRHKHKLTLGCDQCCQATFITAGDGSKRCACKQNGIACETSAYCCSGICSNGACIPREGCGGNGDSCCAGNTCVGGSVCDTATGNCKACGDAGETCCAGSTCGADLICGEGNVCVACGDAGESCCDGDTCGADAACFEGTCYPCGGEGELCCAGDTCDSDLACDPTFGTCEATCVPLDEACAGPSGLPCCTDVNPNAQCAIVAQPVRCQDCSQPPTVEGAMCQIPRQETCCGGRGDCVSAIQNEDSVPVCIQFAQCAIPCETNADCSGVPNNPICIKIPDPDTCCTGQPMPRTAICAQPCPVG